MEFHWLLLWLLLGSAAMILALMLVQSIMRDVVKTFREIEDVPVRRVILKFGLALLLFSTGYMMLLVDMTSIFTPDYGYHTLSANIFWWPLSGGSVLLVLAFVLYAALGVQRTAQIAVRASSRR